MSRAAIFSAITEDETLNDLGITEDSVFPNWTLEERPVPTGPFVILQWGAEESPIFRDVDSGIVRNTRDLVVWAHYPLEVTNDGVEVDAILNAIQTVLIGLVDTPGEDGERVTMVVPNGRSIDFEDRELKTITRNETYQVLSRNS